MLSTDQFTSNEKRPKKSERKTEFKMTSTSECITWFAVFVTGSVIIASVNLLTIIVFLKNRNLRTRAMYLVINLTLADMLVGLLSGSLSPSISLRFSCDFLNAKRNKSMPKIGVKYQGQKRVKRTQEQLCNKYKL